MRDIERREAGGEEQNAHDPVDLRSSRDPEAMRRVAVKGKDAADIRKRVEETHAVRCARVEDRMGHVADKQAGKQIETRQKRDGGQERQDGGKRERVGQSPVTEPPLDEPRQGRKQPPDEARAGVDIGQHRDCRDRQGVQCREADAGSREKKEVQECRKAHVGRRFHSRHPGLRRIMLPGACNSFAPCPRRRASAGAHG